MSTPGVCNQIVDYAVQVFGGAAGINAQLAEMAGARTLPRVGSILRLSASIESYEKTTAVRYPAATLCCQKIKNAQTEKFRSLSGTATLALDIRVTGERAEDIEAHLNTYVEAACRVLESSLGQWTNAGFYAGAYDVKFQGIRPGGKQFTKSAEIVFDIQLSR